MKLSLSKVVIAAIALLIAACNSGTPVSEDHKDPVLVAHDHDQKETTLRLNNGDKWKADSTTNANVGILISTAENYDPVSLDDYHQLGNAIQEGINKLIEDCRMQGADHEALHHWLEPLLEKNKALCAATSVNEAGKIFKDEKEHINMYRNYFE